MLQRVLHLAMLRSISVIFKSPRKLEDDVGRYNNDESIPTSVEERRSLEWVPENPA
jgi:hypothetical protein